MNLKGKSLDVALLRNYTVILFSDDINSNIICLTKHIEVNILNTQFLKITIYISYFLESILKLSLCPMFKYSDVLPNKKKV